MEPRIVPFGSRHVPAAALLLAEAGKDSGLVTADPVAAGRRIGEWAARQPSGLAALEEGTGRLAGFMAVSLPDGHRARARLDQHATAEGEPGHRVRRALYAALSERLVGDGVLVHEADVLAGDQEAVTSFARLGFGIDQVRGFRPAVPVAWDPRVRRAVPDDVPRLIELAEEVQEFHALPPMWRPAEPEVAAVVERGYRRALEDGQASRHLLVVAELPGGQLAGLMQAAPDARFTGAVTIGLAGVTQRLRSTGIGTALLDAVTDWSARRGFARCGAGWTSANPVSDQFWRSRGLVPEAYRMSRVIDRRPPSAYVDIAQSSAYADDMEPVRDITEDAAGADPDAGLRAVAALRALAERLEILQVDNARRAGWSWQQIAERLGVTKQTVHRKHGKRAGRQP